jgi:putative flippase GtrA
MRSLLAQFTRFGLVGLVGLAVDILLFNVLRVSVFSPENVASGPLLAKTVSTTAAIIVNWIGNRLWTFRVHRRSHWFREGIEFALVSVSGMAVSLLVLWISHYVLGFTSLLADNIASNVVGLILGALLRFTLYRVWVFSPHRRPAAALNDEATASPVR